MTRPIPYILLVYILSILCIHTGDVFVTGLFFAFIVFASAYFFQKQGKIFSIVLPCIVIIAYGLYLEALFPKNKALYQHYRNGENATITGTVVKQSDKEFILKSTEISFETAQYCFKDYFVFQNKNDPFQIGDVLQIKATTRELHFARNPHAFNEFLYYRPKKVSARLQVSECKKISEQKSFIRRLNHLNLQFQQQTKKILPEKEAAILSAMLFGRSADLDATTKELYRLSGITHILVISGLHISILSLFFYQFFRKFLRIQSSALFALFLLFLYCLFTGFHPSTIRAFIMAFFLFFSYLLGYENDSINALCVSALVLFILHPFHIFSLGVILSYTSVLFILLFDHCLRDQSFPFKESLLPSIAATMGTSPILLFHFYQFSLYAVLINMIIVPLMAVVLCVGCLAVLASFIHLSLGRFIIGSVFFLLRGIEYLCNFFLALPFSTIAIAKPSLLSILLFYAFVIALLFCIRRKRYITQATALFVFLFLCLGITKSYFQKTLLVFLDVGQGDACIIQNSQSQVAIIDGGGIKNRNIAQQVLKPYLNSQGMKRVDLAFISHPDFDHMQGIVELLDEMPVDQIILSLANYQSNKNYLTLMHKIKRKNIPVQEVKSGDILHLSDVVFQIFYPREEKIYRKNKNNDSSTVMKAWVKGSSVLFTGDIDQKTESALLSEDLQCDILKLSHHGSKHSSSKDFLMACKPKLTLCGSGRNNPYGHPDISVLNRLEELEIPIYNTAKEGAICITFYSNKMKIESMREKSHYEKFKKGFEE